MRKIVALTIALTMIMGVTQAFSVLGFTGSQASQPQIFGTESAMNLVAGPSILTNGSFEEATETAVTNWSFNNITMANTFKTDKQGTDGDNYVSIENASGYVMTNVYPTGGQTLLIKFDYLSNTDNAALVSTNCLPSYRQPNNYFPQTSGAWKTAYLIVPIISTDNRAQLLFRNVKSTATVKYDNITVGVISDGINRSSNQMLNGGFEVDSAGTDITNWQMAPCGIGTVNSADKKSGKNSLTLESTVAGSATANTWIDPSAETAYNFSFSVKAFNSAAVTAKIETFNTNTPKQTQTYTLEGLSDTAWKDFKYDLTLPAADLTNRALITFSLPSGGKAYIDDVVLTPATPVEEDPDNLLTNGSFETVTGGAVNPWAFTGTTAQTAVKTTGGSHGSNFIEFSGGGMNASVTYGGTPDKTYKVMFDYKSVQGGAGLVTLTQLPSGRTPEVTLPSTGGEWKTYTMTASLMPSPTDNGSLNIKLSAQAGAIAFDNVRVYLLSDINRSNIILNSTFEDDNAGGFAACWQPASHASVASDKAKTGKNSLKIVGGSTQVQTNYNAFVFEDNISAIASLSAYLETGSTASVSLTSFAGNTEIGQKASLTFDGAAGAWQSKSLKFTVPATATRVLLSVNSTGTAYIDDVSVNKCTPYTGEIPSTGDDIAINGSFEIINNAVITGWSFTGTTLEEAHNTQDYSEGEACVTLTKASSYVYTSLNGEAGETYKVVFDYKTTADNAAMITVNQLPSWRSPVNNLPSTGGVWKTASIIVPTMPQPTDSGKMQILLRCMTANTVSYDNVRVYKMNGIGRADNVINGSFEWDAAGGYATGWQPTTAATVNSSYAATGSNSLKVTNGTSTHDAWIYNYDSRNYTVGLKGLIESGASVTVTVASYAGAAITNKAQTITLTGSQANSWVNKNIDLVTGPDSTSIRLTITVSGTAYFDDFTVVQYETPNLVANGSFETADAAGWTFTGTTPGAAILKDGGSQGNNYIKFTSSQAKAVAECDGQQGGTYLLMFDYRTNAAGAGLVTVDMLPSQRQLSMTLPSSGGSWLTGRIVVPVSTTDSGKLLVTLWGASSAGVSFDNVSLKAVYDINRINYIMNGGFELCAAGERAANWVYSEGAIITTTSISSNSGTNSLMIEGAGSVYQDVWLAGTVTELDYKITAAIRAASASSAAAISVQGYAGNTAVGSPFVFEVENLSTEGWAHPVDYFTIDPSVTKVRVTVTSVSGGISIDDASLVAGKEPEIDYGVNLTPGEETLQNGSFETVSGSTPTNWTPTNATLMTDGQGTEGKNYYMISAGGNISSNCYPAAGSTVLLKFDYKSTANGAAMITNSMLPSWRAAGQPLPSTNGAWKTEYLIIKLISTDNRIKIMPRNVGTTEVYFDNISVKYLTGLDSTNKVYNGDFEIDVQGKRLTNWMENVPGTVSVLTAGACNGKNAMAVENTGAVTVTNDAHLDENTTKYYKVSLNAKAFDSTDVQVRISVLDGNSTVTDNTYTLNGLSADVWKNYTFFVGNGNAATRTMISVILPSGGKAYIDDVMLLEDTETASFAFTDGEGGVLTGMSGAKEVNVAVRCKKAASAKVTLYLALYRKNGTNTELVDIDECSVATSESIVNLAASLANIDETGDYFVKAMVWEGNSLKELAKAELN